MYHIQLILTTERDASMWIPCNFPVIFSEGGTMVAVEFFSQLDKLHFVDSVGLDDFADRCSYMLSFIILVICFTIVTLKSYVFEPLSCYTATTFSGSNMISYINAFCWVNGTVPADVDTDRIEDNDYWMELEARKMN